MGTKILFLIFVLSVHVAVSEKHVLCYYGTWAAYRNGLGKFEVGNINSNLCTHLVYTFVGINNNGTVVSLDPYMDLPENWGRDTFRKFNALKNQNHKLKTILAVGGWNEGSAKYSKMAANPVTRSNFITSAINMVRNYGFDGLDIVWEYPNRGDTVHGRADIDNYTQLLKETRQEFDKYGLLLSALVTSVGSLAMLSYDVSSITQYLDLVSIMAYDMTTGYGQYTGHSAPLHSGEGGYYGDNTVEMALGYWLNEGCPPEKLVLGLPLYGHTFILKDASLSSVHSESQGPGIAGPYTATSGMIGYNELCYKLETEPWELRTDSQAKVPYAVQGSNWVSYDDAASLSAKVDYALSLNIGGVMVWSIETDDFHGMCHSQDFPLLRAVNEALKNFGDSNVTTASTASTTASSTTPTGPTTTTPTTTTPTTTIPTTTPKTTTTQAAEFICMQAGMTANPNDCSTFYTCIPDASGNLVPKLQKCPSNLLWDQTLLLCNYPELVECVS